MVWCFKLGAILPAAYYFLCGLKSYVFPTWLPALGEMKSIRG